jgi:hypothetical protein
VATRWETIGSYGTHNADRTHMHTFHMHSITLVNTLLTLSYRFLQLLSLFFLVGLFFFQLYFLFRFLNFKNQVIDCLEA